jgi:hypothetical protein
MILRNSVICSNCKEEIISKHRHDFVKCSCGSVSVDGGHDYQRRVFKDIHSFTDTSIMDDGTHELRRQHLVWGNNYDKDMNRLPETVYNPIMNMTSEHIQAILDGGHVEYNKFYKELFEKELKFRTK